MQRVLGEQGPVAAIGKLCELHSEDELIPLVLQAYMSSQPEAWKRRLAKKAYQLGFEYESQ